MIMSQNCHIINITDTALSVPLSDLSAFPMPKSVSPKDQKLSRSKICLFNKIKIGYDETKTRSD